MLGRRRFLESVLGALTVAYAGCGGDDAPAGAVAPAADAGDGTSGGIFDLWRQLRAAIAQSPDHLRARADALVATKDPKALFAFVRDSIRTLPPLTRFESIETAVRFGPDSVLRIGAGTPRERAELLVALLARAGFTASVVRGDPDGATNAPNAAAIAFGRAIELPFEPAPLPGGSSGNATTMPTVLDPDGLKAKQVFDRLRPVLPAGNATVPTAPDLFGMPLVALQDGGSTVYLNTLLPDAVYGEPAAHGMSPAAPMDALRKLSVKVSLTRARDPETPIELVARDLRYDEIAGARLRVSPQPTLPCPLFLQSTPEQITSFVAALSLYGADGVHRSTVTGKAVSAFGDVVQMGADANVSGVPLVTGGDAKSVASVSVTASARAFPLVELEVAPKDAGGNIVAGLAASAFSVQEDGKTVSVVLRENGGGPRVLVLWDGTGSQPVPNATLGKAIGDAIFAAMPNARVQVSLLGGAPTVDGFTIADASGVASALAGISEVSSPVYGGLLAAMRSAPTAIVFFSDGDAEKSADVDALRASALSSLVSCPVIAVGCATGPTPTIASDVLDGIAAASNGKFVSDGDLSNLAPVTAAIAEVGGRRSSAPYRLAYRAPSAGNSTRTVTVTVGPNATAQYAVPETRAPESDAIGVHLELDVDGMTVKRTLAGVAIGLRPSNADALAAATLAVHDFFLGSSWLVFEAGAPTLSAWLDDALGAAIGYEPVAIAAAKNDAVAAYAALETVPMRPLTTSLLAHPPLYQPDDVKVVELGPRISLHTLAPMASRAKLDILPSTRFAAYGTSDGARCFDATMLATLRIGVAESMAAHGSTLTSLGNAPLALLPQGTVALADLPAALPDAKRATLRDALNQYPNWHRVVASDGSSAAFWVVDPATGSALGILPDASGGAVDDCKQIVDVITTTMDQLALILDVVESGMATTVAVIAAVGKAATIAVAEAALSFTNPIIDPNILQLAAVLVCELEKGVASKAIPLAKVNSPPSDAAAAVLEGIVLDHALGGFSACHVGAPCTGGT
ncbi:hypothetical protein AKJ09_02779 [Labilithrix luteola]|uniref:VWFA domain-containing protein n=1 Tax=Labilithrix luteola TaxID=1391654 RepID=A0A0K1PRE8_9BACT|nr:hypothetical protein [Labilithrix luteola]AKU96115.1 hypothetical protein AKJ09_02779 [Labilithrix luteola]